MARRLSFFVSFTLLFASILFFSYRFAHSVLALKPILPHIRLMPGEAINGAVVLSKDASRLAIAGKAGVQVWELAPQGKRNLLDFRLPGGTSPLSYSSCDSPVFSLKGDCLAVIEKLRSPLPDDPYHRLNRIRLWNFATNGVSKVCEVDADLAAAAMTPTGNKIAFGGWKMDYGSWTPAQNAWRRVGEEERYNSPVSCIAISPDGQTLAAADDPPEPRIHFETDDGGRACMRGVGRPGKIRIIDFKSLAVVKTLEAADSQGVRGITFSPDGKRLLAVYEDGCLRQWDIPAGKVLSCLELEDVDWPYIPVAFSEDAAWVAVGVARERVDIWDCGAQRKIASLLEADIFGIALSRSKRLLVTSGRESGIRIWRISK